MQEEERLVVKKVQKPAGDSPEEFVKYFCRAFDLGDGSLERSILNEIISRNIKDIGITSKELSTMLEVPRSTVIYHLNRFIDAGLVARKGRRYFLRENDLTETIEEIEADMLRNFNKLIELAGRFDKIAWDYYGGKERRKQRK